MYSLNIIYRLICIWNIMVYKLLSKPIWHCILIDTGDLGKRFLSLAACLEYWVRISQCSYWKSETCEANVDLWSWLRLNMALFKSLDVGMNRDCCLTNHSQVILNGENMQDFDTSNCTNSWFSAKTKKFSHIECMQQNL